MTTTKTTSTTTAPRRPRQEQAANNKELRTSNTTETETGCNRNKKKSSREGNSGRETSLEGKAAAAIKSSSGGKSYIQERHPRADQKRQRQPRAAQKGNHEGRQAWETRRQKHHDKKMSPAALRFLASFRHLPSGPQVFYVGAYSLVPFGDDFFTFMEGFLSKSLVGIPGSERRFPKALRLINSHTQRHRPLWLPESSGRSW